MAVTAKVGFHLHQHPSHSPHTFLLLHTPNTLCHFHCRSISISNDRLLLLLSSWPLHVRRSRQWDSNAESYNTKNFNFDDNDESEDVDDSMEQWVEVLEDYIDSIWIFKVFGSFGWMLPPIIVSLLLATGPKAFLMALALPLGQSTFTFALQRFQNRGKIKPKLKKKTKKGRSRAYSSRKAKFEEAAEWIGSQGPRKKKKGYQSWISKDEVSVSSSDRNSSNFGGWDELDAGMESNIGSSRRAAKKSRGLRGTPGEKGKNRRLSESDGPLLLSTLLLLQLESSSNIEMLRGHFTLCAKVDIYFHSFTDWLTSKVGGMLDTIQPLNLSPQEYTHCILVHCIIFLAKVDFAKWKIFVSLWKPACIQLRVIRSCVGITCTTICVDGNVKDMKEFKNSFPANQSVELLRGYDEERVARIVSTKFRL